MFEYWHKLIDFQVEMDHKPPTSNDSSSMMYENKSHVDEELYQR